MSEAEHLRNYSNTGQKQRNPAERFADDTKSRAKAIAAKCWDCCANQREEIRHCPMTDCPLHGFRPYK